MAVDALAAPWGARSPVLALQEKQVLSVDRLLLKKLIEAEWRIYASVN